MKMVRVDGYQARVARVKVMISSRTKELVAERAAVAQTIEEMGCEPLVFERLEAIGRSTEEESLRLAEQCNVYVLLLAETHAPIVEKEYETAKKHLREGLLVFVKRCTHDARTTALIERLEGLHTRNSFDGPDDLSSMVKEAVRRLLEEALLERAARPAREAYGTLWDEKLVLGRGKADYRKFMALRGDHTSGIAEGNDNFDVFLVDEPNYANMKAGKRYEYLIREKNRRATDLTSVIPHDGFYYLWIETYALFGATIRVEFRRQNKQPRTRRDG